MADPEKNDLDLAAGIKAMLSKPIKKPESDETLAVADAALKVWITEGADAYAKYLVRTLVVDKMCEIMIDEIKVRERRRRRGRKSKKAATAR